MPVMSEWRKDWLGVKTGGGGRRAAALLIAAALGITSPDAGAVAGQDHAGMIGPKAARVVTDWTVTPTGSLTPVSPLPLRMIWAPDGTHLLLSCSAHRGYVLQVVDAAHGTLLQTTEMPKGQSLFVGLAYSRDGRRAYASGGGDDEVHVFTVAPNGSLRADGDIPISLSRSGSSTPGSAFPAGIALSTDGRFAYVVLNIAHALGIVDLSGRRLARTVPVGGYPYDVAVVRRRIVVTNWADATAEVLDERTLRRIALVPVGHHPSAIAAWGAEVAIANANDDSVSLFSIDDPQDVSTIPVGRGPLLSSSPQDLAFSGGEDRLYVALAGDNAIGVIGLDSHGGRLLGRIPTGWYPTAVRVDEHRHAVVALSAKGFGAGPNATGVYPDPARRAGPYQDEYDNAAPDRDVLSMMHGLLSRFAFPNEADLARDSQRVAGDDRPASPGQALPPAARNIEHVIYIIRENRTYDQVFGDESIGDGDPQVTLFGRDITPNAHALAERFGLFDNFYVDAEGSSDGHNWSLAANASDYTERTKDQLHRAYDFEGASEINKAPGGYLWDAAAAAAITYRDYGEWFSLSPQWGGAALRIISASTPWDGPVTTNYLTSLEPQSMFLRYGSKGSATLPAGCVFALPAQRLDDDRVSPALVGHYDTRYRAFDLRYPDVDREAEWQREFDAFVAHHDLPRLEIVRLGNDHTMGAPVGGYTPQAMVADNDLALGRLVDAVSHSPYWASTAIFVVEDDASNGADHVDAHRSPMLAISPYSARPRPAADHSFADTAALLKTIELLLGLKPMSHFDAAANPIATAFQGRFDDRPYDARPERISTTEKNEVDDAAAHASLRLDFLHPDAADPDELNAIITAAVRRSHSDPP